MIADHPSVCRAIVGHGNPFTQTSFVTFSLISVKMPMTIEEAYSILEVSSSSSETEVKKAYKRLALQVRIIFYRFPSDI